MLLNHITAWLRRHGWLRVPMTETERVAWKRIGLHIAEATPHRRLG